MALLLLSGAFGGCFGSGTAFVTAEEVLPLAWRDARSVLAEPELILAFTFQVGQHPQFDAFQAEIIADPEFAWAERFVRVPDPDVLDGRAQAWAFFFRERDDHSTTHAVIVGGDRAVEAGLVKIELSSVEAIVGAAVTELAEDGDIALDGWAIDSSRAVASALEQDDNFYSGAQVGADFSAAFLLRGRDWDEPVWFIIADAEESGPAPMEAAVGAQSGRLRPEYLAWLGTSKTTSITTGTASLLEGDEVGFGFTQPYAWAALVVEYVGEAPHWPLRATLTSPSGEATEWQPQAPGAPPARLILTTPESGTWRASFEIDAERTSLPPPAKTDQSFRLRMCALSHGEPPDDVQAECGF